MTRTFLMFALTALAITAPRLGATTPERNAPVPSDTTLESNKKAVVELFESGFNKGQTDILPTLVSKDYQGPHGQLGPASLAKTIADLRSTVPDIHYTLDDVIAEKDRVVVRWHWDGTQEGAFRGFPATHKHITSIGIGIFEVENGKITRSWLQMDQLGFLQQIGALPEQITPQTSE